MAVKAPSLKERKAQGAARLMSAVPTSDITGDLVDTITDRILVDRIRPNPNQPRHAIDEASQEFEDLVGSIRQQGLIQPISLWQAEDKDEYMIIAGERRWRAFRRLAQERPSGFARIPATVTRLLGDNPQARALMMGLIENVVREDLKDGERADALARLKTSTGWTYEAIADRMGLGVNRVHALATIARHDLVKEAVNDGRLTQKQALAIAQGVAPEDTKLAGELIGVVQELPPGEVRAVIREAKRVPTTLPAQERVRQARGAVLVGAAPRPERTDGFDLRSGGETVARIERPVVVLGATSLRVTRPRLGEMDRDDFAAMLQRVCEETNIWPQRSGSAGSSPLPD